MTSEPDHEGREDGGRGGLKDPQKTWLPPDGLENWETTSDPRLSWQSDKSDRCDSNKSGWPVDNGTQATWTELLQSSV